MRKLTPLVEGEYLTIALQDTGDLVLLLSEFHQDLRDPYCNEQVISLCKAFRDIECNTNWRITLGPTPLPWPSSKRLSEWIELVGNEDGVHAGDRWFNSEHWGPDDAVKRLIAHGEVVFVKYNP